MRTALRRRRHHRDRGAVLILFALSITAIMLVVALVIDLSNVRNTRQDSKSTTDAAVAAGLHSLVDHNGVPRPWRAVCTSLAYLKLNQPQRTFSIEHRDGTGSALDTSVTGDPCTELLDQQCVATDKTGWAWIRATDGDFIADIRSGYSTPDPAFGEDQSTYAGDNGDPCEQVAVIISKRDPAFFGGVAGESDYDTAIRTVGRVDIEITGKGVPAFVMLERTSCQVLSQAVGASEGGIIVETPNATEPGIIHVDSAGSHGCTGGSEKNFTVYSGTLGSSPKRAGIVVKGIGAAPGILSLYALESGNLDSAWSTTEGVSATKRAGEVISRTPVDDKYNPSSTPTIKNLHEATQPLAVLSDAPDATYATVNTCTGHNEVVAATKVFVDCDGGYEAGNATFANATEIIFNGPVHVPNGGQLYMPAAKRVVVGGNSDGGLSVAGSGRLGINSVTPFVDLDNDVQAACTGREGPTHTNTTQLVIFGGRSSGAKAGALNVSGRAALCQTFVYLAGPKTLTTHNRQISVDPAYHITCADSSTPCPSNVTDTTDAHLDVAGYLKWSAPNQLTVPPAAGAVGVEDLALWTETETLSKVDGTLDVQGVYFFPNGRVETRSPADFTPTDAQFIARSLKLLQGTLQMKPTPANSVEVDISVGISLVR